MTISDWKQEATPDRATVGVCFDRRLLSDLEAAEKELEEARAEKTGGMLGEEEATARIQALTDQVEGLRKEFEGKTRTLVFESIGRRRWADLLAEYPPTKEQKAEFGDAIDHNPETFPPAALVASCTEPGLDPDEAEWLQEHLPVAVWTRIVGACFSVNIVGSRDPFGNGFGGVSPSVPMSKPLSG